MKKRFAIMLLAIVMVVAMIPAITMTAFAADGDACTVADCDGTYVNGICTDGSTYQSAVLTTDKYDVNDDNVNDEVYEISNVGQLYWFAALVNGDTAATGGVSKKANANAVLTANIDLNPGYTFTFISDTGLVEVKKDGAVVAYLGMGIKGDNSGTDTDFDETASEAGKVYVYDAEDGYIESAEALDSLNTWTPIGSWTRQYTGTFNGQGHTVSGVYVNNTADNQGLFGCVAVGRVQNVTVANSYFNGNWYVGGVVGYNSNSTVTNCYNTGAVSGSGNNVGGVVGYNDGAVTNCSNTGSVSGNSEVGGVVGLNYDGTVTNSYYLADSDYGNGGKTADQFASGEVAYLLQSGVAEVDGVTPEIWGQTLSGENKDAIPVFAAADGSKTVYAHLNCDGKSYIYNNTENFTITEHQAGGIAAECFDEAYKCKTCGAQATASLTTAGATPVVTYYVELSDAITAAESANNSTVTLLADVTEGFTVTTGSFVLDLNGYGITGTVAVNQGATLQLGSALSSGLTVTNDGAVTGTNGYTLTADDLNKLTITNMADTDVKTIVNNTVVHGALNVALDNTEPSYVGAVTKPNVTVKIGNTELTVDTYYTLTWGDDVTNVGDKSTAITFTGLVLTKDNKTATHDDLTWKIKKGTLTASDVLASQYSADKTKATVTGTVKLNGNETYQVEGSWGNPIYEDGNYYATFTPTNSDNVENLKVLLSDEDFKIVSVDVKDLTVVAPEWLIPGDSLTLSATALDPNSNESVIDELTLTYQYKIGENGTWTGMNGNVLTLTATQLNGATTVYVKVTSAAVFAKYNETESAEAAITVTSASDLIAALENRIDALGNIDLSDMEQIGEEIDAIKAILGAIPENTDIATELNELAQALSALTNRVGANEGNVSANASNIAALQTALAGLGDALTEIESDSLADALTNLDDAIEKLDGELTALEARVADLETTAQNITAFMIDAKELLAIVEAIKAVMDKEQLDITKLSEYVAEVKEYVAKIDSYAEKLGDLGAYDATNTVAKAIADLEPRLRALRMRSVRLTRQTVPLASSSNRLQIL